MQAARAAFGTERMFKDAPAGYDGEINCAERLVKFGQRTSPLAARGNGQGWLQIPERFETGAGVFQHILTRGFHARVKPREKYGVKSHHALQLDENLFADAVEGDLGHCAIQVKMGYQRNQRLFYEGRAPR